jgi:UPF0755 protein
MGNLLFPYKNNPRRSLAADLMPLILVGATLFILLLALVRLYLFATWPVIDLHGQKTTFFYIQTGSGYAAVRDSLVKKGWLKHPEAFEWLSRRKHYDQKVKAGRYQLRNGMNNNELINLLRSGRQVPVRVVIQNIRSREELAGKIGRQLEVDSIHLIRRFNDPNYLLGFGLTPSTLFVLFIPNTYEFFWNTSGDQLFERMKKEFTRFWTPERRNKADSIRLSIPEIVTLASIVEKESNKNDEKPLIAGVYLNRITKGIPLQADPTIIFAWNDYSIRRVLHAHLKIKSPYNTYINGGLPPGPICLPSVASVDAVLNSAHHAYIFFCAREDLSGYHNFAATLAEHNRNARKYQQALDNLRIK